MFIAALFTAAKTWKQPKCPPIDERIKMWCMYIYIYELEIIILSKVSQTEKDKYHISLICGI